MYKVLGMEGKFYTVKNEKTGHTLLLKILAGCCGPQIKKGFEDLRDLGRNYQILKVIQEAKKPEPVKVVPPKIENPPDPDPEPETTPEPEAPAEEPVEPPAEDSVEETPETTEEEPKTEESEVDKTIEELVEAPKPKRKRGRPKKRSPRTKK